MNDPLYTPESRSRLALIIALSVAAILAVMLAFADGKHLRSEMDEVNGVSR